MWAGLNGFHPRTDFVLGGVRIGMDYMNLATVISEYTQVPVTLRFKCLCISEVVSSGGRDYSSDTRPLYLLKFVLCVCV